MNTQNASAGRLHPLRALDRLDAGLRHRLTILIAPAGARTTARLHRWIEESRCPAAWFRLTPDDNLAEHFLADLIAALERTFPGMLPPPPGEGTSLEDGVIDVINALLDIPYDFALMMDNYSVIDAPVIHAAVSLMLDYLPPQMHLFIVTHTAPPLPLARLRVRRQLLELGPEEAAQRADEVASP